MKNRELIEYIKLCKDKELIKEKDFQICGKILDSEVSIKEFCEVYELADYDDRLWILYNLFDILRIDENRKYALKLFCDIGKTAQMYMGDEIVKYYIHNIKKEILDYWVDDNDIENKALLKRIRLMYIQDNMSLKLHGNGYKVYADRTNDGIGSVLLVSKNGNVNIPNVGAIIFKNNNYTIKRIHIRKDKDKIVREDILKFNYDIALISGGLRI